MLVRQVAASAEMLRQYWRLVLWLLFALAIVLASSGDLLRYAQFARSSLQTFAVVSSRAPDSGLLHYTYLAQGARYAGTGSGGFGNQPADMIQAGDPLRVVYLPDTPQESLAGDPRARLESAVIRTVVLAIAVPSFVVIVPLSPRILRAIARAWLWHHLRNLPNRFGPRSASR